MEGYLYVLALPIAGAAGVQPYGDRSDREFKISWSQPETLIDETSEHTESLRGTAFFRIRSGELWQRFAFRCSVGACGFGY
jgi:hypothetical protein